MQPSYAISDFNSYFDGPSLLKCKDELFWQEVNVEFPKLR